MAAVWPLASQVRAGVVFGPDGELVGTYGYPVTDLDALHPQYGTVLGGDEYFAARLHSVAWSSATTTERQQALLEASERIDKLIFAGQKVSEDQGEEFPRYYGEESDGTEEIPADIINAAYESAYALLDGVNPDFELENLGLVSQGYSSVRQTYDRRGAAEHLAAGIPSASAWRMLKPYLSPDRLIKFSRVS